MQFAAPYSSVDTGNLALHLHPDHLADLRASGLNDETIRQAGVYSMKPGGKKQNKKQNKNQDEEKAPHPISPGFINFFSRTPKELISALCFPYQGGKFARIKLFPSLGKMKYAQPPKTGARLYMPFPVDERPVVVAEGEKKTLASYQAGFNAVGIGGVWNWLSNGEPIADLNLIQWDGREVTIIPDSDIFDRVDLLRAIYALGSELRAQGAGVLIAQIPQPAALKAGLDDFLVAGGNVDRLEVFSLGHSIFKNSKYWHSQWKFKNALKAA
jgi:putative DNA primase/helicase